MIEVKDLAVFPQATLRSGHQSAKRFFRENALLVPAQMLGVPARAAARCPRKRVSGPIRRPISALRRARRPFALSACSHRHTDVRLTWSRRATSAGLAPRCSKRAPSKRRASSSARSRFLLMTASLPSKTRSSDVAAVTQFIKGQ